MHLRLLTLGAVLTVTGLPSAAFAQVTPPAGRQQLPPPTGAPDQAATAAGGAAVGGIGAAAPTPAPADVQPAAGVGAGGGATATGTAGQQTQPGAAPADTTVIGTAGARAAGTPPPGTNYSNFIDTRLTWTFGD